MGEFLKPNNTRKQLRKLMCFPRWRLLTLGPMCRQALLRRGVSEQNPCFKSFLPTVDEEFTIGMFRNNLNFSG